MAAESRFTMTRRSILDYFLGGGFLALLGTMFYPVFRYILPSRFAVTSVDSVRVAAKAEIKPNTAKMFRFGGSVGILVMMPSGEYRAFNAMCTHLSCTVQYRSDLEHLWCACHNGHFDLFGRNIAGPPPTPLTAYDVAVRGDDIFVSVRKA
ncbi:MAG: Rieske (2Fe-2S) protein [Candidatus Tectomicrobia bacterium]|uniref:Rieske (2Fe-2S) protein n=1 Tax=Tectimicrobiota bacterium TaxID=2528274 RepID=A0A932HZC3_UNCTE|nr:Rieske (2Fe-2S) protein [Candidatus Tectomicrobia bacterium]